MHRLVACVVFLSLTSCPASLGAILRQYGYNEVQPPTNMWAPGTVVEILKNKPLLMHPFCEPQQVLGRDFRPMWSRTSNREIEQTRKKSITFETRLTNLVNADIRLGQVKRIKMTLTNAAVYEVNEVDMLERLTRNTDEQRACLRAVRRARQQGRALTFIQSALHANVTYSVEWNDGSDLTPRARIDALKNLAVQLHIQGSQIGESTIDAKSLYLGIREDASFIDDFDPARLRADRLARGSRLIPIDEIPSMLTDDSSGSLPTDGEFVPPMPKPTLVFAPGSPQWSPSQPAYNSENGSQVSQPDLGCTDVNCKTAKDTLNNRQGHLPHVRSIAEDELKNERGAKDKILGYGGEDTGVPRIEATTLVDEDEI